MQYSKSQNVSLWSYIMFLVVLFWRKEIFLKIRQKITPTLLAIPFSL
jgi:hypothetical protein